MSHSNRHRWPSILALGLVLGLAAAQPTLAACLNPGQAQRAIANGQAQRLGAIARMVGGEILDAKLCDGGGGLVYRLSVMRGGGRIENVVVDAGSGQRLN